MALYRHAARRDANEAALRAYVEAHGVTVQPLSIEGGPDWLCGGWKRMAVAEIKLPGEDLRASQARWWVWWAGPLPWLLKTEVDAAAMIRWLRGQE